MAFVTRRLTQSLASSVLSNARSTQFSAADALNPLFETAQSALEKSCYLKIDWKINEDELVSEAVKRMVAHDIGALAVTDSGGEVNGVITERDYLNKVAFLNRDPTKTKISEICTSGKANLVSVTRGNPIDRCMEKMLMRGIRHLLIREGENRTVVGMISVKDIVKCAHEKHLAKVAKLEEAITTQQIVNNPY